jgi:hypothetical protein
LPMKVPASISTGHLVAARVKVVVASVTQPCAEYGELQRRS